MRTKLFVLLGALVIGGLYGCGNRNETDEMQESSFDMQESIEDEDDVPSSLAESQSEETNEEIDNSTESSIENSEAADEKSACEKIEFSSEPNEFTARCESQIENASLCSVVTDMDNDGKSEAFVIAGSEDSPDSLVTTDDGDTTYWWADKIWFVDESGQTKELSDLTDGGLILSLTQKSFMSGESTYIIINGYTGLDGLGYVYTLKDDELINAAPDTWAKGHKDYDGKELIWEMEGEGTNVDDGQVYGHFWMPYYLYNEDGIFKPFDAKEVSKDDITEMAEINLDYLDDAKKCQFILRDNNELDVNYMTGEEDEYAVSTVVYNLSENGSAWEQISSSDGYYIVDIKNPDEGDFLAE